MFSPFSPNGAFTGDNSSLPFSTYIQICEAVIAAKRIAHGEEQEKIIQANAPFELRPIIDTANHERRVGALLVHGLLDCPFSLRDIGQSLQKRGVFCRAILLPGHGTHPKDLMDVSYQDWVAAVKYGVESMKQEVDDLFLIGYSTGAALSVYHALRDEDISGLILLSPAIRLKAPVDIVVGLRYMMRWFSKDDHRGFVFKEPETDYAKYHSIPYNAVWQVSKLTRAIQHKRSQQSLSIPILMVLSIADETISPHQAVKYFSNMTHASSQLLLYTSCKHAYTDQRILSRSGCYPKDHINSISHIAIPFAPDNFHYGQQGDYHNASYPGRNHVTYGAYNRLEVKAWEKLQKLGLTKTARRELTYNPDFEYMADTVANFIFAKSED